MKQFSLNYTDQEAYHVDFYKQQVAKVMILSEKYQSQKKSSQFLLNKKLVN